MASKENSVQDAICEYLAYKHYFFFRMNNAPVFDKGKMLFRRMPKYAKKGVPDIIVVVGGKFVGIEVKTKTGSQSPDQKVFEKGVIDAGGVYIVARGIDDLIQSGI